MDPIIDKSKEIEDLALEILNLMGRDSGSHGMLRGTFEAALAEAQGAELVKPRNFTPAQPSYQHYNSMRDAANGIASRLGDIRTLLSQIMRIDPKAGKALEVAYRPLTQTASQRLAIAQEVEELIVEIAQTRNTARLAGTPLQSSRDAAGLVSNQLRSMNMSLVPNGLATNVLEKIRSLPVTLNEAKDQMLRLGTTVTTAAAAAARTGASVLSRAATAALESLAAFGSRLLFFPVVILPEGTTLTGESDHET